ncbi:MAG TPA: RICIN domain-containing protein, partial [Actinospica sp.]|nr:RICIN domain-containing protein [Actinospica sp.]
GQPNQTWTHTSSNALSLTVGGSTLCLDANNKGTTNGTKVIIWSCNSQTNQQWTINSNGTITGAQSGLCLDVTGASTANGALAELWTCNGGSNQQWKLS